MHRKHPVVVGVDGSNAALGAVRWAAREAMLRSTPLLLASTTVATRVTFGEAINLTASTYTDLENVGNQRLDAAARCAAEEAGDDRLLVDRTLMEGAPAAVLLELARTACMLVVGSRGLGDFTGGLVGSVSFTLATHSPCPVVIVRQGLDSADAEPDGPIVVGVDGSKRSESAIAAAFEEARIRSTGLVAVHAWSDFDLTTVFTTDLNDRDLGWAEIARAEAAVLSESLAGRRESYPDVTVEKVVVRDRPVQHLVEHSRRAQLVVTGSRGRGGFTALVLGSTSRALLHSSQCPLMIVRSGK